MKKCLIAIVLIIFFSSQISAQVPKGNIEGKVVDVETQSPLLGVNIIIKGTNNRIYN